jgi:hypothetical protein
VESQSYVCQARGFRESKHFRLVRKPPNHRSCDKLGDLDLKWLACERHGNKQSEVTQKGMGIWSCQLIGGGRFRIWL